MRRQNLSDLMRGQLARVALQAQEAIGREAFGMAWSSEASDWTALSDITDWIEANGDIRGLVSRVPDRKAAPRRCEAIIGARDSWRDLLAVLLSDLKANAEATLTAETAMALPGSEVSSRLSGWRNGGEDLTTWVGWPWTIIDARPRRASPTSSRRPRRHFWQPSAKESQGPMSLRGACLTFAPRKSRLRSSGMFGRPSRRPESVK